MTPAQRQYDIELAASLIRMATQIEPRSRKVSLTLKLAGERIAALASSAPVEIQPASKPDEAKPHP